MSFNSSCSLATSLARWTIVSVRTPSNLLLSLFNSVHKISFSCCIPKPVTDEIKICGTLSGNVGSNMAISSSSNMSLLVMASTRCLSNISGLKVANSFSRISYSLRISSVSPGTIKSNKELRSIWRRKRSPSPFPSLAPSIIPGISAMTKDFPSR